jgi:hypothetical protein
LPFFSVGCWDAIAILSRILFKLPTRFPLTGNQYKYLNYQLRPAVAQWVDADSGGELEISARFWNTTLTIPKKALSKDQYISMMLDPSTQQIEFGPDGLQFKKPAMLNYTVSGLDLSTVPIGSLVKLYFWNQKTGKFEEMVSESITYDRTAGTLTCVNGEIPHFCIYAFGYIRR